MAMDDQGIDRMALYGTPMVGAWGLDPGAAGAIVRAYNRWVHDFCQQAGGRVIPIGQIDLRDADAAIAEVRHCVREYGFRCFFTNTQPPLPGVTLDRAYYDPLWSAFEEMDVALGLHNVVGSGHGQIGQDRFGDWAAARIAFVFPLEAQATLFSILLGGICERHPKLRVLVLESGAGWLPYLLWYYDELYERYKDCDLPPLRLRPSEYFKRQCFISAELEEPTLKYVVDYLGSDNIVTACDFPHPEGPFPDGVRHFVDRENGVPLEAKRKILCDNAQRLYRVT
jgi:predicted TIM-barrel fold metal-dependent hydrolase